MAISRYNTGQVGEFLVAAELARNGLTVAMLSGNAPDIDLLAYRRGRRPIAVQVKSVLRGNHQFNLGKFLDIEHLEDGCQKVVGPRQDIDGDVIMALVRLGRDGQKDELLWTTVLEFSKLLAEHHCEYLSRHGGRRPGKNPKSMHVAIKWTQIQKIGKRFVDLGL